MSMSHCFPLIVSYGTFRYARGSTKGLFRAPDSTQLNSTGSWFGLSSKSVNQIASGAVNTLTTQLNSTKETEHQSVFTVRLCEAYTHGIAVEILSVRLSVRLSVGQTRVL